MSEKSIASRGILSPLGPVMSLAFVALVTVLATVKMEKDAGPTILVQFSLQAQQPFSANEVVREPRGSEPRQLKVLLTVIPAPTRSVTIPIRFEGDATPGRDFRIDESVTLSPNQRTAELEIEILGDTETEELERLTIVLEETAGFQLGSRSQQSLRIGDPFKLQDPVSLAFTETQVREDKDVNLRLECELAEPARSERKFEIEIVASGTATADDVQLPSNPMIVIPQGQSSGFLRVSIENDRNKEGDEELVVALANFEGLEDSLRIIDDESLPIDIELSFGQTEVREGDAAILKAKLTDGSRKPDSDLVIQLKSIGTATPDAGGPPDFSFDVAEIVIPANKESGVLPIVMNTDSIFEGDETVELKGATSAADARLLVSSASVRLIDRNERPRVFFQRDRVVVAEDKGEIDIPILVEGETMTDLSFTVEAVPVTGLRGAKVGADFRFANENVVLGKGESKTSVKLVIVNDEEREPNSPDLRKLEATSELIRLQIRFGEEVVSTLQYEILDDDFWNGDVLAVVPWTDELKRDHAEFRALAESLLNSDERENFIGGAVWIVDGNGGRAPWPVQLADNGDVTLVSKDLDRIAAFPTSEERTALREAVETTTREIIELKSVATGKATHKGKKIFSALLLHAPAGLSMFRGSGADGNSIQDDAFESPESQFLLITESSKSNPAAQKRFAKWARPAFARGVTDTDGSNAENLTFYALGRHRGEN